MIDQIRIDRRCFLQCLGGVALGLFGWPGGALPDPKPLIRKSIPASGELLPAIGMGSWITFNVGDNRAARETRTEIVRTFFEQGGALIDSSPMYGWAEDVIGYCLRQIGDHDPLFSATKVWTLGKHRGIRQMERSQALWGVRRFDLMQIHNILDWETHLITLREWKAQGRIRYIGITTSHGRRHDDLVKAMAREDFDFVQFTYNILDREAERRLLPVAAERKQAVIINRPFKGGDLFDKARNRPLPEWAREFDCENWAQFFLKFIISHPAVTCAIPATSQVAQMRQNMGALHGRLPEEKMRGEMIRYVESL